MKKHQQVKEIILQTQRGKENDCFGYCVDCPQGKTDFTDNIERKPNVTWIYCGLPSCHSVTFPQPKGRGRTPPPRTKGEE